MPKPPTETTQKTPEAEALPPIEKVMDTEGLQYALNEDGQSYSVVGIGTANETNIVIASEYERKPVTGIGDSAFWGCTGLTSITIPDSVTGIGDTAFQRCTGLTNITYGGTKSEWEAIEKGMDWDSGASNYTVHCTDGDIAKQE